MARSTGATYRQPQTPLDSFSDPAQQSVIREMRNRLNDLESVTGSGASSSSNSRVAPTPPKALLQVTTDPVNTPGTFHVRITNPEDLPKTPPQNTSKSTIYHVLQASPAADFSRNVTTFPPSSQNYYSISELGQSTQFFQIKSSYDKLNFNQPVPTGPHTS